MQIKMGMLTLVVLLGAALPAAADEMIVPLAMSGDWAALAHRPSMTAPADVCLATNMAAGDAAKGVAFRADEFGVEFRVMDPSWSLPANVQGEVVITIGQWNRSFGVDSNTANMVAVEIPPDDLLSLFKEMDKAAQMSVKVGTAAPFTVSLVGSTRATDAFRTCADIKSNSQSPGSNPFN